MLSKIIEELMKIYDERGDLPIKLVYTIADDEGEEYTIETEPNIYEAFNAIWITD